MSNKLCPVVGSYIYHTRGFYGSQFTFDFGIYTDVVTRLEELEENPLALVRDPATQKLRAFYCLHGLFVLLRTRLGGPSYRLPLTREGIQSLIQFCSEARDSAEVRLYAAQLGAKTATDELTKINTEVLIGLTNTIVEAAEYLRPRLASKGPLSKMGRLYVQGLISVRAPSDAFIKHLRELINVSNMNRGGLENV